MKKKTYITHFGVRTKDKPTIRINRENYAIIDKKNHVGPFYSEQIQWAEGKLRNIFEDESCTIYTDEHCLRHREKCLLNFDINMAYMNSLSEDEFNDALNTFLIQNKEFVPVSDLNEYSGIPGIYILVLDDYKQLYIGQSVDIKKRVMSHWSKTKAFDRLIFGTVENSILSIDSFGALDTTRIYAYETCCLYDAEAHYVSQLDSKFLLNRVAGGIGEEPMPNAALQAALAANSRQRRME